MYVYILKAIADTSMDRYSVLLRTCLLVLACMLAIWRSVDSNLTTVASKYSSIPYTAITKEGDTALTFIGLGDWGNND